MLLAMKLLNNDVKDRVNSSNKTMVVEKLMVVLPLGVKWYQLHVINSCDRAFFIN